MYLPACLFCMFYSLVSGGTDNSHDVYEVPRDLGWPTNISTSHDESLGSSRVQCQDVPDETYSVYVATEHIWGQFNVRYTRWNMFSWCCNGRCLRLVQCQYIPDETCSVDVATELVWG